MQNFLLNDEDLQSKILSKAYTIPYSVHLNATKMCKDLKEKFWWFGMKKDVEKCLTCQKIKVKHQRLAGELQLIEVLE